jgi:hypothetical protein
MLMRYLLNSLQSYENSFSDALCPIQAEADQSFMGEHQLVKPASKGGMRAWGTAILDAINLNRPSSHMHSAPFHAVSAATAATQPPASTYTPAAACPSASGATTPNLTIRTAATNSATDLAPGTGALLLAKARIPDLRRGQWRRALKQWYEGEPENGLMVPLRDWDAELYRGRISKASGSKRNARFLIVLEWE